MSARRTAIASSSPPSDDAATRLRVRIEAAESGSILAQEAERRPWWPIEPFGLPPGVARQERGDGPWCPHPAPQAATQQERETADAHSLNLSLRRAELNLDTYIEMAERLAGEP